MGLLALGALVAMVAVARYRHAAVVRDWSAVMSPEAARMVEAVEEGSALDQRMAADAWAQAMSAQESCQWEEAVRLLELAYWVVEDSTPARLERLRAMAQVCRQAAAIMPLPPVPPRDFRLARLRTLAGATALVHSLLVAPAERLALRARMLMAAFALLLWTMRRTKEQARERPQHGRAWAAFEAEMADWKALDQAHLETFRAAMTTLVSELRRELPISVG